MKNRIDNTTESNSKSLAIAIGVGVCALLLIILYGILLICLTWPIDSFTISNAGVFGDSFGVLTSLFSALAFGGVAFTVLSQREEMRTQKQELALQRKEAEEGRKEIYKQGFENTFFQMLKLHNQIVMEIKKKRFNPDRSTYFVEGRDAIDDLKKTLVQILKTVHPDAKPEDISMEYDRFHVLHGYQLSHYFRFLYNIFRFLSESKIDNKILYARLVRAQISNQELFIIYYNAISDRGLKFKDYIVEFKLMDNLSSDDLIYPEHKNIIPNCGFE